MPQAYTVRNLPIYLWGLGGALTDYLLYSQFALLALVYTLDFKLDKMWVGVALLGPRIVTLLLSPVIGHLSDQMHSRFGRRRPVMIGAAVLGALMVLVLFWASPGWDKWVLYTYMSVAATLLFVAWDIFSLAHLTLGYELSDDYGNRAKVMAVKSFWTMLPALGGGYIILLAMQLSNAMSGMTGLPATLRGSDLLGGLRVIGVAVAVLVVGGALIAVFATRERFQEVNRERAAFWPALWATLKARGLLPLMAFHGVRTIGTSVYGSLAGLIGLYYVCAGDKMAHLAGTYTILGLAVNLSLSLAATVGLLFLAAPLVRRVGKRRGIILYGGAALLSAASMPFLTVPGHIELLQIGDLLLMPMFVLGGLCVSSIVPDFCDLNELTTGQRREGLFLATYTALNQSVGLGLTVVGMFLMTWIGYDSKSDAPPSPEILDRMRLFAFAPLIFFSAVAFVISWFVPEPRAQLEQARAELDQRHLASGGIVSPGDLPPVPNEPAAQCFKP